MMTSFLLRIVATRDFRFRCDRCFSPLDGDAEQILHKLQRHYELQIKCEIGHIFNIERYYDSMTNTIHTLSALQQKSSQNSSRYLSQTAFALVMC